MRFPLGRSAKLSPRNAFLLLSVFLLSNPLTHAQGTNTKAVSITCADEIPTGVKVTRVPDADQHKVTISEFSVSPSKNAPTYQLAMQVKNGTDKWCITSFAFTYSFGDARGQEWTAKEYPAVLEFKAQSDLPQPGVVSKSKPAANSPAHRIGIAPGKDEKRVVSDLFNYIQPRPGSYFDGFHLISAEINYCMGYPLTSAK